MKNQRKIDLIVVHCSATRVNQDFPVEALEACHKARGFHSIGLLLLHYEGWHGLSLPSRKRGGCSCPPLQRPQHRNLLRGWSRRERQACRHSHSSPESISGRPPLQSRPRLSGCRDPRSSRPPLGSQELSLLRCQGMAEGNRLPSLENAPHLKTDGEFFGLFTSFFSQYTPTHTITHANGAVR